MHLAQAWFSSVSFKIDNRHTCPPSTNRSPIFGGDCAGGSCHPSQCEWNVRPDNVSRGPPTKRNEPRDFHVAQVRTPLIHDLRCVRRTSAHTDAQRRRYIYTRPSARSVKKTCRSFGLVAAGGTYPQTAQHACVQDNYERKDPNEYLHVQCEASTLAIFAQPPKSENLL